MDLRAQSATGPKTYISANHPVVKCTEGWIIPLYEREKALREVRDFPYELFAHGGVIPDSKRIIQEASAYLPAVTDRRKEKGRRTHMSPPAPL
jgi:hypothetical protein